MWMVPRRIKQQTGRFSRVDGIPYELPINSRASPALMAAFSPALLVLGTVLLQLVRRHDPAGRN